MVTFVGVRTAGRMRGHGIGMQSGSRTIEVAAKGLVFGEVWEDPRFHWSMPLQNVSDHAVTVTDVSASCTCSAVEPKSFTIAPGETVPVRLTIDLTRRAPETASATRDFELMVHAVSREDGQAEVRHSWMVKGRIRTAYRVEPRAIDFGDCSIEAEHLPKKSIIVEGLFPLNDLEVKDAGQFFLAQVTRVSDRPNSFRVSVVPRAGIPIGEFNSEISLRPRSVSDPEYPELKVMATGRIVEDVQCVPSHVDFGSCKVGEAVTEYLTLRSLTDSTFAVQGWEADEETLEVTSVDGRRNTFVVRYTARRAGEKNSRVVFHLKTAAGRMTDLQIPVACLTTQMKSK